MGSDVEISAGHPLFYSAYGFFGKNILVWSAVLIIFILDSTSKDEEKMDKDTLKR